MKPFLVAGACLMACSTPVQAQETLDLVKSWGMTFNTPLPFAREVTIGTEPLTPAVVQQPLAPAVAQLPVQQPVQYMPQPYQQVAQPIPYPVSSGGGNTPGVVVIPITTGQGSSGTNIAELMVLMELMKDREPKPARKGFGSILGDVLTNASSGFARGAAENLGRQVSSGWF